MTREECEAKLLEISRQAYDIYREYYPEGDKLSMYMSGNYIRVNDAEFDADGNLFSVGEHIDMTIWRDDREETEAG